MQRLSAMLRLLRGPKGRIERPTWSIKGMFEAPSQPHFRAIVSYLSTPCSTTWHGPTSSNNPTMEL